MNAVDLLGPPVSTDAPAETVSAIDLLGPAVEAPAEPEDITATPMDVVKGAGRFVKGAWQGVRDITAEGTQLIGRGLEAVAPAGSDFEKTMKERREKAAALETTRRSEYEAARAEDGGEGFDPGRLTGNIGATLPLAAVAPAAAIGTLGVRAGVGAGMGALSGALTPTDPNADNYWTQKAQQAGTGAVIGGGASAVLGKTNAMRDPNVATLIKEKVPLTMGQMMGGLWKRGEDAITGIPILGDIVKRAQSRSTEGLNRAGWNRVLEPMGETLPKNVAVGRDAAEHVSERFKDLYGKLMPAVPIHLDPTTLRSFADISTRARDLLSPELMKRVEKVVTEDILKPLQLSANSAFDGPAFQLAVSKVKAQARKYKDGDIYQQEVAEVFSEIAETLSRQAARLDPLYAAAKKKLDDGWSRKIILDAASAGRGATNGVFSAPQLSGAVLQSTKSNAVKARGDARMQDLSDAGRAVLPSSVADSGTATRLLAALGLTGAASAPAAAAAVGLGHSALALPAALGALYTRPGQYVARKALAGDWRHSPITLGSAQHLPAALPQVRARAKAASEEDGDYADGGSVEDRVRAKLDELSR